MSKILQIANELASHGIRLVGNLAQDATETNKFYAFIEVNHSASGKQEPSNYKLRNIYDSFAINNIYIIFIIVMDSRESIQDSIKSTLIRFFPDIIRNVFTSSEKKGVSVWVEPKKVLTEDNKNDIRLKLIDVLQVLEIRDAVLRFTTSKNLPTRTTCLNLVRLKAPISQLLLQKELLNRGFHIPSEEWLSNILDNLRKAGFLLRKSNAEYVLTLEGLKKTGTRKNKRSPDVARALDITKHIY